MTPQDIANSSIGRPPSRRGASASAFLRRRSRLPLATLLLALLPVACKKAAEEAPTPEVYVQATHPITAPIAEQIPADAILAPLAQAAISPRITAPVRRFYVARGSHVRAGQLLATLENKDLSAAALDTRGAYTAAQATFQTATRATVPEDLKRAQLDLASAKSTLALNQSIVNSRSELLAQGAIPGRDLDTARATLVQSQAAFDIAQGHLQALEQVSREAALQNAEGQLTSARGKLAGAEAQLSYTEIRSPINGIVTDRPLFAGETAAAGTPILTVMDTSALLAKLHLSQTAAQQLHLNAPASIQVPGIEDPVPATVALISPALDPGSTTVEVWLRVGNRGGILKAGTAVHTTLTGRSAPDALTVPAEAVQTGADGASKSVMVITGGGTAKKHPVTLGIVTPTTVQVLSGLSPSDTVITTGSYGLDDGTKVKIGTAPDEAPDKADDAKPDAGKPEDAHPDAHPGTKPDPKSGKPGPPGTTSKKAAAGDSQ